MAEVYEVVLEEVKRENLFSLLRELEIQSEISSDLAVSENFNFPVKETISKKLVDEFIAYDEELCLTERLYGLKIADSVQIPLVFLRVIKYEDAVDVELSFEDMAALCIDRIMLAMQGYANTLANRFFIKETYGGGWSRLQILQLAILPMPLWGLCCFI